MSRVMIETSRRARGRSAWRAAVARRAAGLLAMFAAAPLVAVPCRDSVPTAGFTHVANTANLVTVDSAKKLALAYVCGTEWRIRNPLADSVLVHWDVLNKSDTGSVMVPPAPYGATYSETYFVTRTYGFNRLYFQGALVQSATGPNAIHGTVCPGNLAIVAGRGVVGLQSGNTSYPNGTTVSYSAVPDNGYTSVQVFLDTLPVPSSGTITINGGMTLLAVATLDTTSFLVTAVIKQRFKALLTSPTPVADYQSLIYATGALVDQLGSDQADTVLHVSAAAAFNLPADSGALVQLEQALAGHSFDTESLPPLASPLQFGPGSTLPYGFPSNAPPSSLARAHGAPRIAMSSSGPSRATIVGGRASIGLPPAPSHPRPAEIVHVNGLATDFAGFNGNVESLRSAVREVPLFSDNARARVWGIYNSNAGLFHPILRSTPCALSLDPILAAFLPWWVRLGASATCTASGMRQMARDGGGDALETLLQLAHIVTNTQPLSGTTLDSLVATQLRATRGGNHVIVVPHSQGNLFEIEALQVLASHGQAPTDSDAACVGMVPTASPTSFGYPTSPLRLEAVQVAGDIILLLPPPPTPKFMATSTPYSLSFAGDFAAAQAEVAGLQAHSVVALWKAILDEVELHKFEQSYLSNFGARSLVKKAIADIYANCEVGVSINGSLLYEVRSTAQLSANIVGADGRTRSPVSSITWTSSDAAVVLMGRDGTLLAEAPGMSRVTATYRGQHADALIEVYSTSPDSSLTVTVQNTSADVAPFWLDASSGEAWRRRGVTVPSIPNDSTSYVDGVDIYGYDIYGNFFSSIPVLQPSLNGSPTFKSLALFFDNPRNSLGVPIRFQTAGLLWVMKDEVLVHIITIRNGQSTEHWVRAPLTSP